MTWHAAVAVAQRPDGRVLGLTRGSNLTNINFPGGMRERYDSSPGSTVRREFKEETGLTIKKMRPLGMFKHGRKSVHVFQVLEWDGELKPSSEGRPVWVLPSRLVSPASTFRRQNLALLRKVGPVVDYRSKKRGGSNGR